MQIQIQEQVKIFSDKTRIFFKKICLQKYKEYSKVSNMCKYFQTL